MKYNYLTKIGLTKKEAIKRIINNRFKRNVKNYLSDLDIDKKCIDKMIDEKINFLYILRENGSHLFTLFDLDKKNFKEKMPYLFGTSTREEILTNQIISIKAIRNQALSCYHFKSDEYHCISIDEAIERLKDHVKAQRDKVYN